MLKLRFLLMIGEDNMLNFFSYLEEYDMTDLYFHGQLNEEIIYSRLKKLILCGGIMPGERMPDPYELAGQLSVSPTMVLYSYHLLVEEQLLDYRSERDIFACDSDKITAMKRIVIEDKIKMLMKQAEDYGMEREEMVSMFTRQQEKTYDTWKKEEDNK